MAERDASPRSAGGGLLIYCIGSVSSPLPSEGLGVRGGRLQRIAHGELVAVVSLGTESAWVEAPAAEDLLAYERAIRAQHAVADIVPMRFGSMLPDERAVRAHLGEQQGAYLRSLTRVSSCVEMGVRALISMPHSPAEPEPLVKPTIRSGADYLKARQRRYSAESQLRDHCSALEQALLSKVMPWCREHRVELAPPRPGEPVLCSVYFLVPRDQVPAFRAALSPMSDGDPARMTLSGPWPPFNFVD